MASTEASSIEPAKRFIYPMRWVMVRMGKKQKQGVEVVIRQALKQFTPRQTQEIADFVKSRLNQVWNGGCGPSWQVIVGKTFTYNIAFTRGTAGLITFGDDRESTILVYRSAPYDKELPDLRKKIEPPPEVKRSDTKELAGEHIDTNMNSDLLACACYAIRKARAEIKDESEQAIQIKTFLNEYRGLLPEYVERQQKPKPGVRAKPYPAIHIIIGRKFHLASEQIEGSMLKMRFGKVDYYIFMHSILAPPEHVVKRLLQPGTLIKFFFAMFFLAMIMGWKPWVGNLTNLFVG